MGGVCVPSRFQLKGNGQGLPVVFFLDDYLHGGIDVSF